MWIGPPLGIPKLLQQICCLQMKDFQCGLTRNIRVLVKKHEEAAFWETKQQRVQRVKVC